MDSDLPLPWLLKALFDASTLTAPMAVATGNARPVLPIEYAEKMIQDRIDSGRGFYFDYVQGRLIKTDLGKTPLDFRLYDRDNGDGAGYRAIEDAKTVWYKLRHGG